MEDRIRPVVASTQVITRIDSTRKYGCSQPAARRMLILYGLPGAATTGQRYQAGTDETGRFRFTGLMPGPYMLTDAVAGPRNWRLRVEVAAGQALTLDLSPANSVKVRDDFPNMG